jgi:hypothetical protein
VFLSPDEIHDLTDRKIAAAQIRWLRDRGFKFEVSARGRPKVLKAEVERQMLSGTRRSRELHLHEIH